mmetsp:Transcript_9716/g.29543  ORF Transcript_9716/g.29543 Transcript_9716/m.29543 type:complete len:828 (-) Transcript_9716:1102-3585(-)
MACTEVMEPLVVVVIRSCSPPTSVASVGWYPTADGIRPSRADTSALACVNRKMLSTKSSTSCPSSSRKYSAMARPVRPTRALAPGGSFICPYTRAALDSFPSSLMTPVWIISWYRSLPSRVRSPTPVNTEKPPCFLAMLLISSIINTVLPTPAPPNSPIFPPRAYGASRSTTLMPVMRMLAVVSWSVKSGASRWIGYSFFALISPRSSIGSPMTLMMRPRVSRPTGTMIGLPVSTTFCPRTSPSVASMEMHLTVFSPRCCATSSTRRMSWSFTSSALRIGGSSSSNWTSTTAPMTCATLPACAFASAAASFFGASFFDASLSFFAENCRTCRSLQAAAGAARSAPPLTLPNAFPAAACRAPPSNPLPSARNISPPLLPHAASSDDEFYDPPSTFNNSMELQTVVNMVETDAQKELVNDSSKAQSVDAESQKSFAKSSPSLRTRRKKLPEQAEDRVTPGFVSIMKETVGKDLSTVSLPVTLCEPLSILQRCCEDLEYMELLDRAAASSDPFERLMLAAIFSISHYSNSENRFDKPFTAYPGETFEFTMPEKGKGFKFLAESISRVPSVTACHAESLGRSWKYYYTMEVSNKFYGKTMEMVPHGVLHIEFPEWGDHVTYTLPTTVIHNIVVGKMWVDNYGDIEFLEHREGNRCFMKLQKSGWMTSLDDVGELNGFVVDSRKSVKKNFQGSWRKSISTKDESGINRVIWNRSRSPDVARTKGYNLSEFALLLNEPIPAEEMQSYAPTDVRFRPDLRAYEEGRIAEAARLKSQLEASARSKLEESGPGGVPKWFRQTVDPNTKQKCYLSTDEYWECKETACWDKCQPLYEI